ncbi:MAG TPA: hotdog fold thioesterase [Micromonospora sp.]
MNARENGTFWRPDLSDLPPTLAGEQLALKLGIEVVRWEPDLIVATMPVAGNRQPMGLLHGGANAVLAETLGSLAAAAHAGPGASVVGLELSCTHHRAVTSGRVTGTCRPLHLGQTVTTHHIEITDERGRLTSSARLTCLIKRS